MMATASTADIPYRVTDPELIPVQRYYDAAFYQLECERFWPRVWQLACRLEQLANVGDWIEYANVGRSVIVVRTENGIKAFHNACRHRGVQVASGSGNAKGRGFTCPFHGWRYDLDGRNTFVYCRHLFSDRIMNPDEISLKPCRVEIWLGFVFINFDDDAPVLRDTVGPLGDGMDAYNADKMRAEWWYSTELPANWKVAMEAFMEGYHVMRTHPKLHAAMTRAFDTPYDKLRETDDAVDRVKDALLPRESGVGKMSVREILEAHVKWFEELSTGMASSMLHAKDVAVARSMLDVDLPDEPVAAVMEWYRLLNTEIMERGRARGEATPDLNAIAANTPVLPVTYFFPNWFVLPYLSSMAAYRIRPTGPETCTFEIWSLTHFAEGQEPPLLMEPVVLPHDSKEFPPVPQEDYANIPFQQKGLHAGGFDYMRLARNGEGLLSNFHRVLDAIMSGVSNERLVPAMQQLSASFDGPILDLGL